MALYRRTPDTMSAKVGDDVVALQATRGFAYGMENVTAAVWAQLEEARSLDDIVASLCADYEVEPAQCRSEVSALLRQMVDEALVEEVEA